MKTLSSMKTIKLAALLALLPLLALPLTSAPVAKVDDNIYNYLQLLRSDFNSAKVEIINRIMKLSADDAKKFWPIYREYDLSLSKIADRRIGGIKNYTKVYDTMTDSAATSLVEESYKLQKDRLDLLMDTFKKVSKATNPQLAARFIQIENQIITLLDMKIIEEVPLIEKGPKSAKEKK